MEKLWRKAQRTVGVLLAMAMLASAVPAQALADEASSASGSESTSASSDSASSASSSESTGASSDSASSASSSESTGASGDNASSASSSESTGASSEAGNADSQSDAADYDAAGASNALSAQTYICWPVEGRNIFTNNTTDEHVHIYYSTNGRDVEELLPHHSVETDIVTGDSDFVGIEFYIAVDEGYTYGGTTFTGRSGDNVDLIDEAYDELKTLNNDWLFNYKKVSFVEAIEKAKTEYHATHAFIYSGIHGLGKGHTGRRFFLVTTEKDPSYATIVYKNTLTGETWDTPVLVGQPNTVWPGVDTVAGMNWTTHEDTHEQLAGWSESDSEDAEVQYALDGTVTPSDDMTLYTVWEPIQYQYTIRYFYDDVENTAEEVTGSGAYDADIEVDATVNVNGQNYMLDPEKDHSFTISDDPAENQFCVYYVSDRNGDGKPDKDQTVTLTFDAGEHGTLVAEDADVTSKEYKLLPGDKYPVVGTDFIVKAQDNWCFTGWDTDYTFSGSVPDDQKSAAYTYTAQYAEDLNHDGKPDKDQTVTLTFDAGEHGTFAEGESGMYTRLPGEAYPEAPAVNVEEGWMLTDWYDANGNLYTAEGEVTDQSESATYTASYEEDRNGDNIPDKNQKYTITYTAGENGTVTVAKETAGIQGVAGIQGSKAVANTGYTVDGWYKGDVKITDGDTLTPDAIKANLNTENGLYKDTAFTARFVQLPQTPAALTGYTVRYLEDGTGYEVASPKTVSGVAVGTTVTETAPDLAGYSLMSDKNPQSITLSSGENVITFYYRAIGGETDTTTAAATPAPAAVPVIPTTPTAPAAPAATRAPAAAGPSVTAAPTTAPTEEPEEEVVPEEETPQAQEPAEDESIADEETPLAGSTASGWALLNLILTILTALGAVVLVVGYFMGYTSIWRLLSLIPGVGGVAAFLLTEDMSQAMTFVDGWTVLMVIIAVVQIVLAVLAMKGKNTYEENDEDEA